MQPVGFVGLGLMGGPSHTPMPFVSIVHDRMVSAVAKARGDMDWTALGLNVSEDAGLESGA